MARLVIVSNRVALPGEGGGRAGGLAVALGDALARDGGLWFGWSGQVADPPQVRAEMRGAVRYAALDLSESEHAGFYAGFCNGTIWPLFHYRLGLFDFRRAHYAAWLGVNERFASAIAPMLRGDDTVWVHDYHFIPFAAALRARGFAGRIGFFLHIPFPAPEVLSALPVHRELVRMLFACDLVGFHTEGDAHSFREYALREAGGAAVDADHLRAFGRTVRVGAFPVGIDVRQFAGWAQRAAGGKNYARLVESLAGRRLMIGVDRLDYSKGLDKRLEAVESLFGARAEHRGKVTFMQIAPISRGEVAQYRALRRALDAQIGRINGKYAEFDWAPVRWLNKAFPRRTLAGFHRAAKVGVVTPLRDGMNLVAKEYVAAQDPEDPGVLVLSLFAGAARQLGDALVVNPFDPEGVAEALHRALEMPLDERRARWRAMMAVLEASDRATWRASFLEALTSARSGSAAIGAAA